MAEALGLGVALWGPLGGGLLTGKYRSGEDGRLAGLKTLVHTESDVQKSAVVDAVLAAADELRVTAAQVAVAWVLGRAVRSTTGVVPIIGPRTVEQLAAYLGALDTSLSAAVFERLDAVSAIDLGQPHGQIAEQLPVTVGGDASAFVRHGIPVARRTPAVRLVTGVLA